MVRDPLVTVAEFNNTFDAELSKVALETENIHAVVIGDNLNAIQPYSSPLAIKLQVFETDASRAAQILQDKHPLAEEDQTND